jgi:hypothetical protein
MPTENQRLSAAERQRNALELRKAGIGYQQIADALGYRGVSGAYYAVQSALKRTMREPSKAVRALEQARLDKILSAVWPAAISGDLNAIDRVLKIMARRAALLGLNSPRKIAPTNPDGTQEYGEAQYPKLTDEEAAIGMAKLLRMMEARSIGPFSPDASERLRVFAEAAKNVDGPPIG